LGFSGKNKPKKTIFAVAHSGNPLKKALKAIAARICYA